MRSPMPTASRSTRNSARNSTPGNTPRPSPWPNASWRSPKSNTAPKIWPLTNPLTNLATVHYKLGQYPAAIENYQRTLRILQAKSTIADKQQIRPLHGLGVSFMGAKDPESAVVALKRAADLSRNTDGLFNINQVEFIDALIDAYEASGRFVEAEKESLYAMRVEEAAYGRNSIKLLNRLDKLARLV